MSEKKLKINVSFPKYDKHIYDFIKEQENPSAFVRKLVEAYMNGVVGNLMLQNQNTNVNLGFNHLQPKQDVVEQEIVVDEVVEEAVDEETKVGEFNLNYEKISEDQLDQLNNLNF